MTQKVDKWNQSHLILEMITSVMEVVAVHSGSLSWSAASSSHISALEAKGDWSRATQVRPSKSCPNDA